MSEASESAHVRLFLADYAVADAAGKITLVGGGISIVGINPATGTTAPFAAIAVVSFDPKHIGETPAVELGLEDEHGRLVVFEGPNTPLRIATAEKLSPPALPHGVHVPNDAVRPKTQTLMQFQNGLPLQPGNGYLWRVWVDQDTRPEWTETLYVATASPGAVFG
jgi:hypothetical protein